MERKEEKARNFERTVDERLELERKDGEKT